MTWAALLKALPEIINFIKLVVIRHQERQGCKPNSKELKEKLGKVNKALKDGDEKALNDAINSL